MAKIEVRPDGVEVARRFELVIKGVEIANGYFELTDGDEQGRRFSHDQIVRRKRQLINNPIDKNLLAAMQSGLPSCSGVALGLDRLLMFLCDAKSIDEVLTFPFISRLILSLSLCHLSSKFHQFFGQAECYLLFLGSLPNS